MIGHWNSFREKKGARIMNVPLETNGTDYDGYQNMTYTSVTSTTQNGIKCTTNFSVAGGDDTARVLANINSVIAQFYKNRTAGWSIEFLGYYQSGAGYQSPVTLHTYIGAPYPLKTVQFLSSTAVRLAVNGLSFTDITIDNVANTWYWFRWKRGDGRLWLDYAPLSNLNNVKTISMSDGGAMYNNNHAMGFGSYPGQDGGGNTIWAGKLAKFKVYQSCLYGPMTQ